MYKLPFIFGNRMSLPLGFADPSAYFRSSLTFLKEFSWIYCSSNTRYIKEGILNRFPNTWAEYFTKIDFKDLNGFPDGLNNKAFLPESLKGYQQKLEVLKPTIPLINLNVPDTPLKRMSRKKSHEILRLSKLISEICDPDMTTLIDFGSGLGYLSEALCRSNSFKILGLECDRERVELAKKRQTELYVKSSLDVVFREERVTTDSLKFIEAEIARLFPDSYRNQQAIIGLHACADLSITAMELFLRSSNIKMLIIMPCCYHKLELSTEASSNGRLFKNFPLSSVLTEVVESSRNSFEILNRPFLRLACQQTVSRWRIMSEDEHRKHGSDMFLRALVECLAKDDKVVLKTKGISAKPASLDFDDVTSRFQIVSKVSNQTVEWTESRRIEFMELKLRYPNGEKLSEGLTCLQTALQGVCENLVLLDRVCFLQEYATNHSLPIRVNVKRILDDQLSPRCFAFVAEKLN